MVNPIAGRGKGAQVRRARSRSRACAVCGVPCRGVRPDPGARRRRAPTCAAWIEADRPGRLGRRRRHPARGLRAGCSIRTSPSASCPSERPTSSASTCACRGDVDSGPGGLHGGQVDRTDRHVRRSTVTCPSWSPASDWTAWPSATWRRGARDRSPSWTYVRAALRSLCVVPRRAKLDGRVLEGEPVLPESYGLVLVSNIIHYGGVLIRLSERPASLDDGLFEVYLFPARANRAQARLPYAIRGSARSACRSRFLCEHASRAPVGAHHLSRTARAMPGRR